jgi:hypothetical protein
VRADCGSRLFPAKLAVVVHYPTRQVFDQLLADHATLLACHSCDCLRDSVDDFICFSPADETVARSTEAHAAARSCFSVSAADTFTSVHRFKGSIPQ